MRLVRRISGSSSALAHTHPSLTVPRTGPNLCVPAFNPRERATRSVGHHDWACFARLVSPASDGSPARHHAATRSKGEYTLLQQIAALRVRAQELSVRSQEAKRASLEALRRERAAAAAESGGDGTEEELDAEDPYRPKTRVEYELEQAVGRIEDQRTALEALRKETHKTTGQAFIVFQQEKDRNDVSGSTPRRLHALRLTRLGPCLPPLPAFPLAASPPDQLNPRAISAACVPPRHSRPLP